jgi:hypothetical protein
MCGNPVGVEMMLCTSPRQKHIVMSIKNPRIIFEAAVHTMARGKVYEASRNSSDM